ncbi:hypothetical protein [Thysanoplusia orichalcea nucleopolyhedrovirus]|uniref:Viral desmoplakin N-terminal domain-containing protein n=1 Tax=Thysanoplusia orichalcea nucleopolyhedrovirus TaxID=101850 RepID=L0CJZ4_9ABAC|nr:hypothetical protein [Thysanoplusia orichalcea nucleopolyhedrovirus]AGA16217.1 hypothetical protein [Thysanoplusia orichalcea nucleopolyhedrovirus]
MQRWPKYGGTDVNTRTVHDLLNTINTMSARIKTLEQYEHALRQIHKVVVILKPSANTHKFEPDALPALIMQYLSEFAGRDINTLTHNINYKYDYNYPHPPTPASAMPPPPPPQQPPAPPYYNNYPYYPPYPFSMPPTQPPPESSVEGVGGSQNLNQITLTNEEESELAVLLNNMQTNLTWECVQSFIQIFIRIVRVHVINNVTIINVISALSSVRTLIDYNFTEFIKCVYLKTNIRFAIDQYLCATIVIFVEFFSRVYTLMTQKSFQFATFEQLTEISTQVYTQIATIVTQNADFTMSPPSGPRPFETINYDNIILDLQDQLKRERALHQQISEQHKLANDRVEILQTQYNELDAKYKEIIDDKSEFAQQKNENIRKIKQLEKINKDLDNDIQELRDTNAENLSQLKLQKNDIEEYKANILKLNEEIHKLKNKLDTSRSNTTDLNNKIESLERQIDDKQGLNEELKINIAKINETTQKYKLDAIDIIELKQAITVKDQELAAKSNQYLQLNSAYEQTVNELNAFKNQLSQTAVQYQTLQQTYLESQTILEGALAFINSIYQIVMQIDKPDYVTTLKPQFTIEESKLQMDTIESWMLSLKSKLSNIDTANLQPNADLIDLKTQIASKVPKNILNRILKKQYNIKPENYSIDMLEPITIISAVSALAEQYDALQNQNVKMKQDFEIKLDELERTLQRNKSDVESISEFISRDPALNRNLNDERFQNLKQQYDEMSSKYLAMETTKIKEMELLADQAVKMELGKLNAQVDELNSLFIKYNSKAQEIFEWKSDMLKRYETLARTTVTSLQEGNKE